MKKRKKEIIHTTGGAIVGTMVGGPVGGIAGAYIGNRISKPRRKKKCQGGI